jgi:TatD DNase family protein
MTDSHCHLDFDAFDSIRDKAISEAIAVGVHTIINIGADLVSSRRSAELARTHDMIYAAVGVHPHDAKALDDKTLEAIRRLAHEPKVVAIGEIGLDYYRNLSPHPVQQKAFERQLELAVELQLPVVIHTREAFEDTYSIVARYASDIPGGVFHCFPGSAYEADRVMRLGFMVSFGGVITYQNSRMARTAQEVPLDHILLETDAPYLTPVPYRGKTNQPAYVKYVCDKLAELQGVPSSEVEQATDRNCSKLFGLAETFGG